MNGQCRFYTCDGKEEVGRERNAGRLNLNHRGLGLEEKQRKMGDMQRETERDRERERKREREGGRGGGRGLF